MNSCSGHQIPSLFCVDCSREALCRSGILQAFTDSCAYIDNTEFSFALSVTLSLLNLNQYFPSPSISSFSGYQNSVETV